MAEYHIEIDPVEVILVDAIVSPPPTLTDQEPSLFFLFFFFFFPSTLTTSLSSLPVRGMRV